MEEIKQLVDAVEQLLKQVANNTNDMKFLIEKLIGLQNEVINTKERLIVLETYSRFKPSYFTPPYNPTADNTIKD